MTTSTQDAPTEVLPVYPQHWPVVTDRQPLIDVMVVDSPKRSRWAYEPKHLRAKS